LPDRVLIEQMTWTEVREAIDAGCRTAVLACGAVEQHGPHLPTGTDRYLGTAIAERAARLAGNALVAPTLRPGLSEHHMHFPGSFTVRPETFIALLQDYCHSLARHGFERIVLFPSHGGNADTMRANVPFIAHSLQGRAELVFCHPQRDALGDYLAERGVTIGRAGAHAGFTETSMMLAYRPGLVHADRFEPGRCDDDFYRPENIGASQMESFLYGIQTQAPNGILGDPTGSTAQDGERLLDLAAEALARELAGDRRPVPVAG
jgi:creatinine amidohydrolase